MSKPWKRAGILQIQEQPFLNLRGSGVLVGIVDTGIDYTSSVFRYEDGTSKIVSIFDQSTIGTPPYDFRLGQEYTREQINQALQSEDPFSVVSCERYVGTRDLFGLHRRRPAGRKIYWRGPPTQS